MPGHPFRNVLIHIFHVSQASHLAEGDTVAAGQLLGTHASNETMSDIAVLVYTTQTEWRYTSYFDVLSDGLFQTYQARGVASRDAMIISKEARDADPLACSGQTFTSFGTLESWVTLN